MSSTKIKIRFGVQATVGDHCNVSTENFVYFMFKACAIPCNAYIYVV